MKTGALELVLRKRIETNVPDAGWVVGAEEGRCLNMDCRLWLPPDYTEQVFYFQVMNVRKRRGDSILETS